MENETPVLSDPPKILTSFFDLVRWTSLMIDDSQSKIDDNVGVHLVYRKPSALLFIAFQSLYCPHSKYLTFEKVVV